MSFTDRKPFIVSQEQTKLRWGSGFWCKLCGHQFRSGDTVRWIYANGTPGAGTGNFFVCSNCDASDDVLVQKAKQEFELAKTLARRWKIYGPDWEHELRDCDEIP